MPSLSHSRQTLSHLFIFINTNIGNTGIISSTMIAHSLFIAITFNSLHTDKAKRQPAQPSCSRARCAHQEGHGKSSAQSTNKMSRPRLGEHSMSPGSFRKSPKPIRLSRTPCYFHKDVPARSWFSIQQLEIESQMCYS